MGEPARNDRFHTISERHDLRTPWERDVDRILHSSALQRLAGVTQVVSPAEAPISHSRLTHTLKAAQIGRRMAQKLKYEQPDEAKELCVDPDVVEAASLAHDLGHPPFGHITERVLDDLMVQEGILDGFEGNAQSFRIVNKLALRRRMLDEPARLWPGINLTRATLNAMLKYPWIRSVKPQEARKWGAYTTEIEELEWVRELMPHDQRKSVEAALVDWADDIAYSVYDVEDFYKAGLIPLDRLVNVPDVRENFLNAIFDRWKVLGINSSVEKDYLARVGDELFDILNVGNPYYGGGEERVDLREMTSYLIARYINSIRLSVPSGPEDEFVKIVPNQEMEIKILKELTWIYVINNPALARRQYGKSRIIRDLFNMFVDSITSEQEILPVGCRERLHISDKHNISQHKHKEVAIRSVTDSICTLTDGEALRIHRSLIGSDSSVVFDNSMR